ncbi:MAG: heme-binding protein [Actinobacteria bacterium]|nr:heme-binding protein [Actinomycetota bacterium]
MAIEEASYTVVERDGEFEIRDYAPHVLAETVAAGSFDQAGNEAFGRLFRYISGDNRSRRKVAMTAPVSQEPAGEKIAMTAPVEQQPAEDRWVVSFTMPASYALETLPEPGDPQVTLRQVPARRMAALRYSGLWTESSYLRHKMELESWVRKRGLRIAGDPVWARYNPPFAPWFLRRNEILAPVDGDAGLGAAQNAETTRPEPR